MIHKADDSIMRPSGRPRNIELGGHHMSQLDEYPASMAFRKQKRLTERGQANLNGGDEEDRTPDLRIANATLSQLSYVPKRGLF